MSSDHIIIIEGKLPSVKERESGCWYEKEDCSIVYWTGKILKCIHDRQRCRCKDCNGASICIHRKIKISCKECKGNQICIHDKIKHQCRECRGSQICIHDKRKTRCKQCKGASICKHDKEKSRCKQCKGASICKHDREKSTCKECKGNQICMHDKRKTRCSSCAVNRKNFCKVCDSVYVKNCAYYPLCCRCYCLSHPDEKIPRRYKLKQHYIYDKIKEIYESGFEYDKTISGGCSSRRPDFLFDRLTHSVIVEIDEEQHIGYSCENKRTMSIFEDLGNRPLVIIRFNPDNYRTEKEEVSGCFTFDEKNSIVVNSYQFEYRMKLLLNSINHHINSIPDREITEIKLFFNE